MAETFLARDAKWEADIYLGEHDLASDPGDSGSSASAKAPKPLKSGASLGKKRKLEDFLAKSLRSGTQLCKAFNTGKCKKKQDCKEGAHLCAHIIRDSGHVCGGRHAAHECNAGAKYRKRQE
jgi:hypothetical protein